MHLRAPSVDQGVHAFGWSVVFFLYMWLGALAIDVPGGIAFVVSLVAARRDLPVRPHRGGEAHASTAVASGPTRSALVRR